MPGGGKVAVVILWIQFALGACVSAVFLAAASIALGASDSADWTELSSVAPWLPALLLALVGLVVAVTIFTAVFAVKIPKRSARARFWCVTLQVVSIVLSLVEFTIAVSSGESLTGGTDQSSNLGSGCMGLVLSLILIALLSTNDMRKWCDR